MATIGGVGFDPAVNLNTNKIYAGSGPNTISVINGSSNNVTATIQAPGGYIAVNPVTNKIYVLALGGAGTSHVFVIDGATNKVVQTIYIQGDSSGDVAVNPTTNLIYATSTCRCFHPLAFLYVINGTTDTMQQSMQLGSIGGRIGVNPITDKIYVSNGYIYVINGSTNTVASQIGGFDAGDGFGINQVTNKIYVSTSAHNIVGVINGSTNSVISTIPVGKSPDGNVGVNPNTNKIYVANSDSKTVSVLDGRITVPSTPQNLNAYGVTSSQINLSWSASSNNGGSAITGYKIERSTDNGTTWSTVVSNTGSTSTLYVDTGLVANTTYTYNVSAVSAIGTSASSNTASATTLPSNAVVFENDTFSTDLSGWQLQGDSRYTLSLDTTTGQPAPSAHISGTTSSSSCSPYGMTKVIDISRHTKGPLPLSLNWIASSDGYQTTNANLRVDEASSGTVLFSSALARLYTGDTGWQFYSSDISSHVIGVSQIRISLYLNDCGISMNNNNRYDNISLVGAGSSSSSPSAPTGLSAVVVSSSQINLSWTAPSSNGGSAITGYKVYRGTASGSETLLVPTGNATSYNDTVVTSGQFYFYKVTAVNSVGESPQSNEANATPVAPATNGIVLNNVQSTSGTTSSTNQMTLASFNAGAGSNQLLLVGTSANNNNVASVTFGGVALKRAVSSFYNNDAEFWYLKNPTGTGDIVVTMNGPTSAVVGAYSFSGVNQTSPIATHAVRHNTTPNNPTISITTKYANDWVLDLPSIYGGSTLGSPTCTQQWDLNVPNAITGASSSKMAPSPGVVTCKWTASSGDMWDDVAVEIRASR